MKSKKLRLRNLPEAPETIEEFIRLKPKVLLVVLLLSGMGLTMFRPFTTPIGIVLIILAIFALLVMPDGDLMQIRKDYMVLYNNPGTDMVTLVYYDDIVSWSYEWHSGADILYLDLTDGSTETQELYSKVRVARSLKKHAPGKEKKKRNKR